MGLERPADPRIEGPTMQPRAYPVHHGTGTKNTLRLLLSEPANSATRASDAGNPFGRRRHRTGCAITQSAAPGHHRGDVLAPRRSTCDGSVLLQEAASYRHINAEAVVHGIIECQQLPHRRCQTSLGGRRHPLALVLLLWLVVTTKKTVYSAA